MAPNVNKAKDSITSIFDILHRKSMIDSSSDVGTMLAVVHGDIEFHHVSYRYATRPDVQIFKDLCLIIPSGKVFPSSPSSFYRTTSYLRLASAIIFRFFL